jgi:hypothetical protein
MKTRIDKLLARTEEILGSSAKPDSGAENATLRQRIRWACNVLSAYGNSVEMALNELTNLRPELHLVERSADQTGEFTSAVALEFARLTVERREVYLADSIGVKEFCVMKIRGWLASPPSNEWSTPQILAEFTARLTRLEIDIANARLELATTAWA